jgi:branched-chain amino acid transport system ATP-binding protein
LVTSWAASRATIGAPLLSLEAVSVAYGRAVVVADVSLQVDRGEIVTLTGPNGAGKTTLLRAISGLTPARAGRIWFDGRRIDRLATYRTVELGIAHVPEGRMVFGDQTVEDNLLLGGYGRHLRGERRAVRRDVEALMERFPILGARRRLPAGLLSGGEQQQLAIARGLMARPRLLLLDEPSLGLAPARVSDVFRTLVELQREGLTILLAEQHATRALKVAGRGYVLQAGRVRAGGTAEELRRSGAVSRAYLGTGLSSEATDPGPVRPEDGAD